VTEERLTVLLAEHAMGWRSGPDRFLTGGRNWTPRWRFNPLRDLDSAFSLLTQAVTGYSIHCSGEEFRVSVSAGVRLGEAVGNSLPRTISLAVAQALNLEVDR
jgi:hypothetical protein